MSNLKKNQKMSVSEMAFQRGEISKVEGLYAVKYAVAEFNPTAVAGDRSQAAHTLGVFLPKNSIVLRAWYDVITTFTSAGADAGTIKLGVAGADAAFVAAIAISDGTNPWDAGIHGALPGHPALGADAAHDTALEVAALFAGTAFKNTAEVELVATVATQNLTAGKLNLFVEYLISG